MNWNIFGTTDESLAVGSIRVPRQTEGQRCHIRSCEQTITGRRLNYRRALEIVQNEEYLSAADRSVIRWKSFFKLPYLLMTV